MEYPRTSGLTKPPVRQVCFAGLHLGMAYAKMLVGAGWLPAPSWFGRVPRRQRPLFMVGLGRSGVKAGAPFLASRDREARVLRFTEDLGAAR